MMKFEERTLDSKLEYCGKVLKVEKDIVSLSNGSKGFREIIRHPGGVVILAMKDEDTILMVKQFRYAIKKTMLELPAGKLEPGENPDEACKRELKEETGYCAKNWKNLGYIYTTPGICDEKLHLYLATDLEFCGQTPDEDEIIEFSECKLYDIINLIMSGEITDSKTICAITRAFGFQSTT